MKRKFMTLRLRLRRRRFLRSARIVPRDDLVWLGTSYGGWTVPRRLFSSDSVCYLAGAGEDISFDLGLIERYGCTVHAFDPVPRSQRHVDEAAVEDSRFVFHPVGLWSEDTEQRFYAPYDPSHVSHSAVNLHAKDDFFVAQVRSVRSLMDELGHDRVDFLKLSVEGAEYEILDHVLTEAIPVRAICVEYSQPVPLAKIIDSCARLENAGYDLVNADIEPWSWRMTLVRRDVGGEGELP